MNWKIYFLFYLRQHLKLFAALVKVDEALGDDVGYGRVDHDEVREEGAQVGNGPVADPAGVLLVLLQHLLQVVVLLSRGVREPRRPLPHQQLPLGHSVVLLTAVVATNNNKLSCVLYIRLINVA